MAYIGAFSRGAPIFFWIMSLCSFEQSRQCMHWKSTRQALALFGVLHGLLFQGIFCSQSLALLHRHTTLDSFFVPHFIGTIPGVCYPVKLDCLICMDDAEYSPLPGTTKGGETKHHQHNVWSALVDQFAMHNFQCWRIQVSSLAVHCVRVIHQRYLSIWWFLFTLFNLVAHRHSRTTEHSTEESRLGQY